MTTPTPDFNSPSSNVPTGRPSRPPVITPDEASIMGNISESVIEHPILMEALDKVRMAVCRNAYCSEPRHVIVAGQPGCGKSTLCDLIENEFCICDRVDLLGLSRNAGSLITSVPSPVTPRSMAAEMLRCLGVTRALHQTTRELTEELIYLMTNRGVKLVVLDEFQHLFSVGESPERGSHKRAGRSGCTNRQLLEVQDWLKSLIVKSGVTFVLVGQPSITALILSEPQLARRFTQVCSLRPFSPPDEEGATEIGAFVDGLLLHAIDLSDHLNQTEWSPRNAELGQRMHLATRGVPSAIKDLVLEACLLARRMDDQVVRISHFAQAYETTRENIEIHQAIREAQGDNQPLAAVINPFTASIQLVRAELYKQAH